jgi:hypothetical protein
MAESERLIENETEAIECLESNKPTSGYVMLQESIDMAIQALEKQIPKKPIMKQYFEDLEEEYLCCPTCGEILTDRIPADNKTFYFHCMNCGQKFDWSDEE